MTDYREALNDNIFNVWNMMYIPRGLDMIIILELMTDILLVYIESTWYLFTIKTSTPNF